MARMFRATITAGALVALTGAITVSLAAETDYSRIPPTSAEVAEQLAACTLSLEEAMAAARKAIAGTVQSAVFVLDAETPVAEIVIYTEHDAFRVMVDAATGGIREVATVSRFPGEPVQGDWDITESGVMYYDLEVAEGDRTAADENAVQMHFVIWLIDGTQVDSTYDRGESATFLRSRLLPGWRDGLEGMTIGSARKLIIPSELAFGERGGGQIPPNAIMVIDVDLLGIDPYIPIPEELPGEPVSGEPVVTESGLQYYELVVGEGTQPLSPNHQVKVHYTGYLNDGTKFDSSVDRGEPITFALDRVIQGWSEGVKTMRVGGKRKLVIPFELGYGERGSRGIPPRATLIFDVELLEILPPSATATPLPTREQQ